MRVAMPVHLRAGAGLAERGAQHVAERAEMQLVGPGRIALAAVHAALEARVVGADELAGATAALRVAAARDAAVRAEVAREGRGERGGFHASVLSSR